MNFAGSEQVIYDFQINMGTGAFNSAITFPDARTSYEKLHDVYPVGVKKFISGDMPTGLDSNQLYYIKKTGSNYKFYLTLGNAVAETSHFVFTDAKDFVLVFTKFRRTIGTQSIASDVGDMYCCEVPALNLNSTVLYDRCTVVFDGTSYTLKRVSLFMDYFPGVSFLFRSDAFLKDGLWQGIDLIVSYKDLPPVPAVYPDYDHMTLTLIIGTASTYNQLGLPHVNGQEQEILEGGSGAAVNEIYLSIPSPSSITAIASTAYTDYFGNYHYAGGYGYWAVPPVVITSLVGSGATAVANVGSGGRITNFTITNGGSGYYSYSPFVDNSINVTVTFNFERRFELINPDTGTTTWPTSSFPYSGTLTDADTVRNLPSISYAFSGTSVMPPATVVLKGAYFAGTKATPFPTAFELPNCVAVATSTITLSGLQTIGGVPLQAGDRILVMGNNSYPDSSKSNGIYLASSGSWSRSGDVFVDGSFTFVNQGAGGKRRYRLKASAFVIFPIVFGTSPLFFTAYNASDLPITYDNVDLGDITTTCYHDAETDTYYSGVMTLNGISGRINFSAAPDLPLTSRAKFLLESSSAFQSTNTHLSNDDFNGWFWPGSKPFATVSDPPGVVPRGGITDSYHNLFSGAPQSKPVIDTRLFHGGLSGETIVFRTEDASRTGAIMTLKFSRVGRAVKSLGLPEEILYIKAYYGDSYITTL